MIDLGTALMAWDINVHSSMWSFTVDPSGDAWLSLVPVTLDERAVPQRLPGGVSVMTDLAGVRRACIECQAMFLAQHRAAL